MHTLSPALSHYFANDTPEALAHAHVSDASSMWDYNITGNRYLDEPLLARSAAYLAMNRFLGGKDLYILPNNVKDLEAILRRYTSDAINNYVAQSRSALGTGGYWRTSEKAWESISSVLAQPEKREKLLKLHTQPVRFSTFDSRHDTRRDCRGDNQDEESPEQRA